jgi:hypothetical protein
MNIQKLQEDIRKEADRAFKYPLEKTWDGDSPISAFDEHGIFRPDNWNDARVNIFRAFFNSYSDNSIRNTTVQIGSLKITHKWEDDQNYVTIEDLESWDIYGATWYKERGCTENILLNRKPITLEQFKKLIEMMLTREEDEKK